MGVVSWGDGCGRANSPGVYTNLSVFNDWLDDQQLGLSYRQKRDLGVVRPGSYTHNLTLRITVMLTSTWAIPLFLLLAFLEQTLLRL